MVTYHYYDEVTCMLLQQDEKIAVGGCVQKACGEKWQLSLTRYLPGNNNMTVFRQTNIAAAVKKVTLYPNPVKEVLHIHGLNGSVLTIVNIQGVIVKRLVVNADTYHLNVSAFAKGMHYLKVQEGGSNKGYQFIKE